MTLRKIGLFPVYYCYSLSWRIETAYFRLKQELSVEKFSGKTANSVRQDFWASMALLNAVAVFQQHADDEVQKRQEGKNIKHKNRARTSDLIITLRDRFIFAALCGIPTFNAAEMDFVIKTMARSISPVPVHEHQSQAACSFALFLWLLVCRNFIKKSMDNFLSTRRFHKVFIKSGFMSTVTAFTFSRKIGVFRSPSSVKTHFAT